ncbi:MAG: metallophosphoesterase [Candidatus Uhrbacteria bacterium]
MHFYFDFVIFFFLIIIGAYLVELVLQKKIRKQPAAAKALAGRKNKKIGHGAYFFSFLFFYFLVLSWIIIFYGSIVEPRIISVNEYEVSLSENAESNLRVAVISDLHLGPYKKAGWVSQVVARTNKLQPDMVWLVGDYIFDRAEQAEMLTAISQLEAPLGVYAITGNHDYYDQNVEYVVARLEEQGVKMLRNTSSVIRVGDNGFVLAGVDDLWYGGNLSQTLQDLDSEDPVVLLAHNPDAVLSEVVLEKADLVVSGHTHGGQIRLPWLGAISDIPDLLGRDYDQGLFDYQGINLLISSGVSETGPRARLFNPPEILLLNLWF